MNSCPNPIPIAHPEGLAKSFIQVSLSTISPLASWWVDCGTLDKKTLLAVIVFDISCLQVFNAQICKGQYFKKHTITFS